jgi:predicted PurR-regulated permease PerM
MLNQNKIQIPFFLGLLGIVVLLSLLIMWPYFNILILACVLAITLYPVYNFFLKITKGKETLASLISVIAVVILILIPAGFLGYYLFGEVKSLYSSLVLNQNSVLESMTVFLQNKLHLPIQDYSSDFSSYLSAILAWIGGNLSTLFSSVFSVSISLVILIMSLFYLFKNGKIIINQVIKISPLNDEYDKIILEKMNLAVNSISRGYFIIAVAQGTLLAGGFAIFGVPNYLLWGVISSIAWLIPIVGVGLIVLPALVYLFIYSSIWSVVGLAIWSLVLNVLAENSIMPILFKKGMAINPLLMVLAILGGILVGPLILSLLFALIEVYPLIIKKN